MEQYRADMSEADMLQALADYVEAEGGRLFHIRDARGQNVTGLPDVIAVLPSKWTWQHGVIHHNRPGLLAFFELKTQRDRVTDEQKRVLNLLHQAHRVEAYVVRPNPKSLAEISLDDALHLLGKEDT